MAPAVVPIPVIELSNAVSTIPAVVPITVELCVVSTSEVALKNLTSS